MKNNRSWHIDGATDGKEKKLKEITCFLGTRKQMNTSLKEQSTMIPSFFLIESFDKGRHQDNQQSQGMTSCKKAHGIIIAFFLLQIYINTQIIMIC